MVQPREREIAMRQSVAIVTVVLMTVIVATGCGKEKGPTDANLEKITVGMSLAEIEAIIGKGTPYSDLDFSKVRLGFSIEDPTGVAQRNTYVWLRPHDNSAYVVTFENGKLMHSMTVYPPKKQV